MVGPSAMGSVKGAPTSITSRRSQQLAISPSLAVISSSWGPYQHRPSRGQAECQACSPPWGIPR